MFSRATPKQNKNQDEASPPTVTRESHDSISPKKVNLLPINLIAEHLNLQ
jgi:hypothetical protein